MPALRKGQFAAENDLLVQASSRAAWNMAANQSDSAVADFIRGTNSEARLQLSR